MNFKSLTIHREPLFIIGRDDVRGEPVLAVGVAGYYRYFTITERDAALYETDRTMFLRSVWEPCTRAGTKCIRYLCSDLPEENNPRQMERLKEKKPQGKAEP